MKSFLASFFILFLSTSIFSQVYVSGYYKKDGTYVQPHYRSNPDGNPYNNWSYPGNTNPYTGKIATGNPDTYLENYYNKNKNNSNNPSPSTYNYNEINSKIASYLPNRKISNDLNSSENWFNNDLTNSGNEDYIVINNEVVNVDLSKIFALSQTKYVTAQKLNLRIGPSTESSVMREINYAEEVVVIEHFNKYWDKVLYKYEGIRENKYELGFVSSSYLSSELNNNLEEEFFFETPEKIVYNFLTALSNRDFYKAFLLTEVPNWNSYSWFSSTNAYGGITNVVIYNIEIENMYSDEAIVSSTYYAEDPSNKSDVYKHIFILNKINSTWKIVKIKPY